MRKRLLSVALAVLAGGCLFSSTAPKTPPTEGGFEVWGLIYHSTNSGIVQVPDTWVRIWWMRLDPQGELQPYGPPDVQGTGPDGAYRVSHRADSWVAGIMVEALTCRWDPAHPDPNIQCCLLDTPTCQGCEGVWLGQAARPLHPGQTVRFDVTARCGMSAAAGADWR